MIDVDMIGRIRRAYFEQHQPIREIVRLLTVSRTTVRKMKNIRRAARMQYSAEEKIRIVLEGLRG